MNDSAKFDADASTSFVNPHLEAMKRMVDRRIDFGGQNVMSPLYNPRTAEHCQVFELYNMNGGKHTVTEHMHARSDELFYVVKGLLEFNDGIALKAGESRIVKAGEKHGGVLHKGSLCIVVVHPPEEKYK